MTSFDDSYSILAKIHMFSVHKSGTLFYAWVCLASTVLRQETLWSQSWEHSLSLRRCGREQGSGKGHTLSLDLKAVPTGVRCGRGVCLAVLRCHGCSLCCIHGGLGGVQVGLLLKLADIFLVSDALVAEPVGYLCERRAEEGGGAEESDIKQPQQRAPSSGIVSRCHV